MTGFVVDPSTIPSGADAPLVDFTPGPGDTYFGLTINGTAITDGSLALFPTWEEANNAAQAQFGIDQIDGKAWGVTAPQTVPE